MKKIYPALFALLTLLAVTGCKKSSGSGQPSGSSDTYLPVTKGTTWTYAVTTGTGTTTQVTTLTGATQVINSKTYYVATDVTGGTNTAAYFYAANHRYAFRSTTMTNNITIELQLADDEQAPGYTWTTLPTDDGTINDVPAQTINTIKEKNITKVVSGKTYSNVIHTQVELQYDLGGGFSDVGIYDIYLAKGVGIIDIETSIGGNHVSGSVLTSYTIK